MQAVLILSNVAHPCSFLASLLPLSSSTVLSHYCDISVNSMTGWSELKLPKIVWPSPLKYPYEELDQVQMDSRYLLEVIILFLFYWLEVIWLYLKAVLIIDFFYLGLQAVRWFLNQTVTQRTLHPESYNIALTFIFQWLIILSTEVEN